MHKLFLEDLNLVSLGSLLHRLPGDTTVSALVELIGKREIFSEEQAVKILAELGGVEEPARTTSQEILYQFALLRDRMPSHWLPEKSLQFPLKVFGEKFVDALLTVVYKKTPVPGHWPGAHTWSTQLVVSNPKVGQAFWPKVEELDVADTRLQRAFVISIQSAVACMVTQAQEVGGHKRQIQMPFSVVDAPKRV